MADYLECYNFLMTSEDPLLKHASVPDPVPPKILPGMTEKEKEEETLRANSARAISGINSYYFPNEFAIINGVPQKDRGSWIQSFYEEKFWNYWFSQLAANEVAKRVFDSSVNQGSGTAVRLLQKAVNTISSQSLTEDGHWGPRTLEAANRCDGGALVDAFKEVRCERYKEIAANRPTAPLNAWLARASK